MPQITNTEDAEDDISAMIAEFQAEQRQKIVLSLDQIAAEVSVALSGAKIDVRLFLTVPSSGPILTFATPLDPDDTTWDRVSHIVNRIVSRAVGVDELVCQEAPCASAGTAMSAADLLMIVGSNGECC
jgi:hypothetical protein